MFFFNSTFARCFRGGMMVISKEAVAQFVRDRGPVREIELAEHFEVLENPNAAFHVRDALIANLDAGSVVRRPFVSDKRDLITTYLMTPEAATCF